MSQMAYPAFKKFAYILCRFVIRTLYRIEVSGPYQGIQGPAILIANHRHAFDVVAVHTAVKPWIYWVAKKELFTDTLPGRIVSRLGCIPVDRDHVDIVAGRGIFGHLRAGDIVGIFPQATRVPDDMLNEVAPHTGAVHFAIKTGVPLIPVGIDKSFRLFRKTRIVFGEPFRLDTDSHRHYEPEELDAFALQMMQTIFRLIDVEYHGGGKRKKKLS